MNKKSLSHIFNKELSQTLIIISAILLLIITLVLATIYKYIYINERQHAQRSINYFFNNTTNLVNRIEKNYNNQLKNSLINFYRGYRTSENKDYISSQMKKIKKEIKGVNKADKINIGQVNYYFINPNGQIFSTDYKADQGLDLSQSEEFWTKLKALEKGEVLLLPLDNETLTSRMRLYAYIKLPDNNYFELGILFEDFNKVLLKQLTEINQDPNLELKLFTYEFDPFFDKSLELTKQEKQLLQQSAQQNKLIEDNKSLFEESYYQAWTSKYGNLYAVLDVNHSYLQVILNAIIILLIFLLITIYLTHQKLQEKIKQIITPIEVIAEDMDDFYHNKETNIDQEETGILEIDNIITNYDEMATEISASYEQLEAYSEELENKNEELSSNKKKLRKIIDLSPNHIFIKDISGKYILVNQTHANFFDKRVEELEDMREEELFKLDDKEIDDFLADDREVINNKIEKETLDYVRDENGNNIVFETVKIPFEENDTTYVLAIVRDITEQKKSQDRIKEQKEELEASYQQLEAHNKEILDLNHNLELAYQERDNLVKKLERVISLTSDLTQGTLTDKREFLSQLLHSAFEIIEEVDYGSVYLFGEEYIEFIDVIGHDLDLLQSINIEKEVFHSNPDQPEIIDHILDDTKLALAGEIKETFVQASKPIKKSIVFSLVVDDERKAGFSLDIAIDSEADFSDQSIEIIHAFNSLAISFYTLQNYNIIQSNFQKEVVGSLINLLEVHDQYTKGHSENVSRLGTKVAFELGLSIEEINDTYWAGMLHDIGKTVVPKGILNKAGKLTEYEYEKIKQHPFWGYKALKDSEQLKEIAEYIYYHHERPDGNGYPQGVSEEEIPLISKILTVVDAWDAMRSTRAYRSPLSKEKALQEILDNKGTQFSPEIVEAFVAIIEESNNI